MIINVIDPRGMQPRDWCDRMVLELDRLGTIPVMVPGFDWREWAKAVVQVPRIANLQPPNPLVFEFEEWAIYFNDAVAGDNA